MQPASKPEKRFAKKGEDYYQILNTNQRSSRSNKMNTNLEPTSTANSDQAKPKLSQQILNLDQERAPGKGDERE